MTRIKDIISENHLLKKKVESLQKELKFYTEKNHETYTINDMFSVTKYNNGKFVVSSKYHSKSFYSRNIDETKYGLRSAIYTVKNAYIKDALSLLAEDSEQIKFGGFDLRYNNNIPLDTILVNPKVAVALKHSFDSCYYEPLFRDILDEAEHV